MWKANSRRTLIDACGIRRLSRTKAQPGGNSVQQTMSMDSNSNGPIVIPRTHPVTTSSLQKRGKRPSAYRHIARQYIDDTAAEADTDCSAESS